MSEALSLPAATRTKLASSQPLLVSLGIVCLVCLWVVIAASQHTALHHDMAEQFVWAHAWQLGYPKHPPLPTWLFMATLTALPPRPETLYALSAICFSVTGVCTYFAAKGLMGERAAVLVAVLWGLQQPFGWRAWIYNHNTVLVMTVAFTLMCTVYATRKSGRGWWFAAGIGAGLAVCTKLQALVPLSGLLWTLWRTGDLKQARARSGLALALTVALLTAAAPMWWMLGGHSNVLAYATHQLGSGATDSDRVRLSHFFVSELRMLMPTLVVLLTWVVMGLRRPNAEASPANPNGPWAEGLLLIPLAEVLAMGILGGATLHAQWGVQTMQFASLALVIGFMSNFYNVRSRTLLSVGLAVQAISLLIGISPWSGKLHAPGAVQGYPSAFLAQKVQSSWSAVAADCPLRFVSGPFFEGGQLSAFLPTHPAVLQEGDASLSPWINMAEMARAGSVVMAYSPHDLPADVWHTHGMTLAPPAGIKGINQVFWGIRKPQNECAGSQGRHANQE
jgi:4-amino-4-deoxy-L-arabinose transferase-like glycosyltransferase